MRSILVRALAALALGVLVLVTLAGATAPSRDTVL